MIISLGRSDYFLFGLVFIKKITKLFKKKNKTKTEPKPVQTDRFQFGFFGQKPVQTGLALFFLLGSVFLFGLVFFQFFLTVWFFFSSFFDLIGFSVFLLTSIPQLACSFVSMFFPQLACFFVSMFFDNYIIDR